MNFWSLHQTPWEEFHVMIPREKFCIWKYPAIRTKGTMSLNDVSIVKQAVELAGYTGID